MGLELAINSSNITAMRDKYASRKLWGFVVLFTVASVFLWFGKLTGAEWGSVTEMSFLWYVGGNVGEHFSKRGQE